MLEYLYGLIDLCAGISLLSLMFSNMLQIPIIVFGILVLLKALKYIKHLDLASFIDLIAVAFIGLAFFEYYYIWTYVFAIWLIQKGIRSFT